MAKQRNIWKYYDDWKVHITKLELFESVCQTFNLMNQIDRCTKYYDDGTLVSDSERYERCGRTVTINVIEEIGRKLGYEWY